MKRTVLIVALLLLVAISLNAQRMKYEIFASAIFDLKTNEISQMTEISIHAYLEKDEFVLNESRKYKLYNRMTRTEGMKDQIKFDAVDNKSQRCSIIFETNTSASWSTKNCIYIIYEGSNEYLMYFSRDPKQ